MPQAAASRGGASPLQELRQLTPRDRYLLDVLAEHQVLTTEQIAKLAFPSRDRAERRALQLTRRGILARFRRCVRPGSQSWRYALGHAGAAIAAARRDTDPPRPAAHQVRLLRLAESPRLDHLIGVNGFFADLAQHARDHPGCALTRWYSERRATDACAGLARPDGLGTWIADGRTVSFFLEYDTGTERPAERLAGKLARYRDVAIGGGPALPVLFWLPTLARETRLWRLLGHSPPVPVATASAEYADAVATTPAGAIWLTTGPSRRLALSELPRAGQRRSPAWPAHPRRGG